MTDRAVTDRDQALANYRNLLAKVDATFAEVRAKAGPAMRCGAGCHTCCAPGLTVNALEAEHLRDFIGARPALVAALAALDQADPHGGTRCKFLDAAGRCAVYEARPIVCRSHGAPLEVKGPSGDKQKYVCPLNFEGVDLDGLPAGQVVNLDLLNTLLTLIDSQLRGASAKSASPRTPLRIAALLPGRQSL